MTRWRIAALAAGLVSIVGVVYASNGGSLLRASLSGYEEVPTLSSSGNARRNSARSASRLGYVSPCFRPSQASSPTVRKYQI